MPAPTMNDELSSITIPVGVSSVDGVMTQGSRSYSFKDATARSLSLEYINGTQTQSTMSWIGNSSKTSAFDGMLIAYRLPYDSNTLDVETGNPPTLAITLENGAGSTVGPYSVILADSQDISGELRAGTLITLAYDESVSPSVWRAASVGTEASLSSESILPVQNKVLTSRFTQDEELITANTTKISDLNKVIYGETSSGEIGDGTESGIVYDISLKADKAEVDNVVEDLTTRIDSVNNSIEPAIATNLNNFYADNIWVWKDEDDAVVKGYKEEITTIQDKQTRSTWDILLSNSQELGVDANGTHSNNLTVISTLKLGNYTVQINSDGSWEMS